MLKKSRGEMLNNDNRREFSNRKKQKIAGVRISPKICCFFKNLAANYFLHFENKFSNEPPQFSGLTGVKMLLSLDLKEKD